MASVIIQKPTAQSKDDQLQSKSHLKSPARSRSNSTASSLSGRGSSSSRSKHVSKRTARLPVMVASLERRVAELGISVKSPTTRNNLLPPLEHKTTLQVPKSPGQRKPSPTFPSDQKDRKISLYGIVRAAGAFKRLRRNKSFSFAPPVVQVVPKMENSYRLEPNKLFDTARVEQVIKTTLTQSLLNFKYTSEGSKHLCPALAAMIKMRVKKMGYPRYKIVSNVIILQNKGQGSEVANRCVWNTTTDSYSSYTLTTKEVIAIGHVHGIYFE